MRPIYPLLLAVSLLSAKGIAAGNSSGKAIYLNMFENVQIVPGTSNLENLAIRHTGDILVTSTSSCSLYQVPPNNDTPPILVANISDASGLLGIVELERDIFYVVGSNISGLVTSPGSNRVWRVDMRAFVSSPDGAVHRTATVSLVARLADALLLNGMSRLASDDDTHLLIADSLAASVIQLNVRSGKHVVFANDSTMAPLPTGLGLGINGIHIRNGTLYYTSLDQGLFASIDLSGTKGLPHRPAQVIATGIVAGDDFTFSRDGRKAYVANNGESTITEVDIPGRYARVLANSSYLQASSAVAYGGIDHHGCTSLYVTGAMSLNGGQTIGRVVKACLANP